MAIITRYEAAKKYGMSQMALKRQQDKNPRPTFFVDIKDYPHPKIDDQNHEWKAYVARYKARMLRSLNPKDSNNDDDTVDKLLSAMDQVITEEFGKKKAIELKFAIIERMD